MGLNFEAGGGHQSFKKKSYNNASNFNQPKQSIGSRGLSNTLSITQSLYFNPIVIIEGTKCRQRTPFKLTQGARSFANISRKKEFSNRSPNLWLPCMKSQTNHRMLFPLYATFSRRAKCKLCVHK